MTIIKKLLGTGISGISAQAIVGSVGSGKTATGTNQATAMLLSDDMTIFSTVASGTGAILPSGSSGNDLYTVVNNGANAVRIYPPVSGRFDAGTINAAYQIPANGAANFKSVGSNNFVVEVTAADFSGSGGAGLIGWIQSGIEAIPRTIASKLIDTSSVKDFGAVGDGVTSDQTAIENAVADAYTNGRTLQWPNGTYLSTNTIPHFHQMRHIGPGVVKRGSDLFYVQPSDAQTNYLYVSTAGNDSNDGLTAAKSLLTVQKPFDLMSNYGPCLQGFWRVAIAAGTYTEGQYTRGLESLNRIVIQGPSVGGHPNVPTAIIDGTTATSQAGLFFQAHMNVQVQDIKCQNFIGSAVGYGVCADEFTGMYCKNVHTTGNQYAGICADDVSVVRVEGGIHNANVNFGLRAHDNSAFTFGYRGEAVANRPQITNNYIGIAVLDGAEGHIDYCDINNNTINILIQDGSRAHVLGTACSVASTADLQCDTFSTWYDDPSTTNTFASATPYIHAHSVDYANRYWDIFDKTNGRRKWGGSAWATPTNRFVFEDSASGSTFLTAAAGGRMILDSSTDNIYQFGAGGSGYQSGISHAKSGTANVGNLLYTYSDNSYRMRLNSIDSYRWTTDKFIPVVDAASDLGGSANRYKTAYLVDHIESTLNCVTTVQFDKTNSGSYSNITGLAATLVAGATYAFRAVLSVTSGASGGVACALGGTATATSITATGMVYNGTTLGSSQKTTSATGAVGSYTGVATNVVIEGAIVVNAAGTLTIRFAQNVSDGTTSSVLINSTLTATRVA